MTPRESSLVEWRAVYDDAGNIVVTNGTEWWCAIPGGDTLGTWTTWEPSICCEHRVKFRTRLLARRRARALNRHVARSARWMERMAARAAKAGEPV